MTRLPIPGGDSDDWGYILNEFLGIAHNTDGTLRLSSLPLDTDTTLAANSDSKLATQKATKAYVDMQAATPDATGTTKGKLRLAEDLAGTSDSPTIPRLTYQTVVGPTSGTHPVSSYADATAAITAAITSRASGGGGIVYIKEGVYNITSTIQVPFDARVTLMGSKRSKVSTSGGTILKAVSALSAMFDISGNPDPADGADLTHDTNFEHITFDGNSQTTTLFTIANADVVGFRHCRIRGATNSIEALWNSGVDPTAATIPGGITVHDCIVSANSGIAIRLEHQTQCWITDSWFEGTDVQAWVYYLGSNKIHINECEFNQAITCFDYNDTATRATYGNTAGDCTFYLEAIPAAGQFGTRKIQTNNLTNASSVGNRVDGGANIARSLSDTMPDGFNYTHLKQPDSSAPKSPLHVYQKDANVGSSAGATIEQGSTGDAALHLLLTATRYWSMGIDNSDADKFKIAPNVDVGSSTALSLDVAGNASLAGALTVNGAISGVLDPSTAQQAATKNYVDTQVASKQSSDATLTALAAYNANGLLVQTAADTFAGRSITGTANQITVSNGDGVGGNPALALPQDIHTAATPNFNQLIIGSTSGINTTAEYFGSDSLGNLIIGARGRVKVMLDSNNNGVTDTFDISNNGSTSVVFSITGDGGHVLTGGTAPSIAANGGAGTAPSIALAGTDTAGTITLTTGTAPQVSADVCTITFGTAFSTAPRVVFSPANGNAAALSAGAAVYSTSGTANFKLSVGSSGLVAATQYAWQYHTLG